MPGRAPAGVDPAGPVIRFETRNHGQPSTPAVAAVGAEPATAAELRRLPESQPHREVPPPGQAAVTQALPSPSQAAAAQVPEPLAGAARRLTARWLTAAG